MVCVCFRRCMLCVNVCQLRLRTESRGRVKRESGSVGREREREGVQYCHVQYGNEMKTVFLKFLTSRDSYVHDTACFWIFILAVVCSEKCSCSATCYLENKTVRL